MYNILTFNSGQPIVLYRDNEKVFMYVILRGKVIKKGILFNNVKSDFQIFGNSTYMIFYISTDDQIKLIALNGQHFVETLSLPLNNPDTNTIIENVTPVFTGNELYIFYISHNLAQSTFALYCLKSSSKSQYILLKNDIEPINNFSAFASDNKMYIAINHCDCTQIYESDSDFNLKKFTNAPKSVKEPNNESDNANEQILELQSALETISNQYNELSEYVEMLQKELKNPFYHCNNAPKII